MQLDSHYAPPCLQLRASLVLMQVLRVICESLSATRAALLRVAPAGMERSRRDDLIRDLNAAIVSVYQIFRAGREHREAAYRILVNVVASLSLLFPSFDPMAVAEYSHSAPADAFRALADRIRQMAQTVSV